ncbi:DUF6327 family protein [Maribacter sp. ACAM166]|uniref:DUF6327 family protein n=1 Tax=Maribacter sp. ACAM166 TaxID=2508996 RepID=UPI0026A43E39
MITNFRSFEEIDKRLNVLKLQRQIDQESLKLHLQNAKIDLVPRQFRQGIVTTLAQNETLQNMVITFITKRVLDIIHRKRKKRT